jgi:signal transduction histidine kinase
MDANETRLLFAFLMFALMLGLILSFFVITIVRHHRHSLRLYQEKIAAEIQTLERERSRIASDLHDHVGLLLSTVKLQAQVLQSTGEWEMTVYQKMISNIDVIIHCIRMISNDLRPPELDRFGLQKAVEHFVADVNDTGVVNIVLQCGGSTFGYLPETDLHIFRIVQEVVHNMIKHSSAKCGTVMIDKRWNGRMRVLMTDDGQGFDFAKELKTGSGSGLMNIVNRVEMLRGVINVESDSKGTVFKIDIPYE